jgi:hypothetical protein
MLSDGTLTGTAGYGSGDGRGPRTPDPAAAPPSADKRGGRAWRAGPDSRQGSLRHHRRPDLTVAPVGSGRHLRPPERLFAPGSADVTAPLASLPGSAASLGPQTASACQDNAVLPYIRHYGNYSAAYCGCARRSEKRTARRAVRRARSAGTRAATACTRQPGNSEPGRTQGRPPERPSRDLLGRPGPVTMRRLRREHAFWRLAKLARPEGGDTRPLMAVTAARPRSSCPL